MADFTSVNGVFFAEWWAGVLFLLHQLDRSDNVIVLFDVDHSNTLSGATHGAQIAHADSDDHALFSDEKELIVVHHMCDAGDLAILVRDFDIDHTHAAAMNQWIC